jgi:hypothetical protein
MIGSGRNTIALHRRSHQQYDHYIPLVCTNVRDVEGEERKASKAQRIMHGPDDQ